MAEKKEKSLEEIKAERKKIADKKNGKEEEEKEGKDRSPLLLTILAIFLALAAFVSIYYEDNWFFGFIAGFTALICLYSAFENSRNNKQIKANKKAYESKEEREEKARRNDEVNRMIAAQNKSGKNSGKNAKKGGKKKK